MCFVASRPHGRFERGRDPCLSNVAIHEVRRFSWLSIVVYHREPELGEALQQLGEYVVKSRSEAELICDLLERSVRGNASFGGQSALHALIGLFQDVEGRDCAAFSVMVEHGLPILIDVVDAACDNAWGFDHEDALFALKILAMYGTSDGAATVVRAIRKAFQPGSYWWHLILEPFGLGHPCSVGFFRRAERAVSG